MPHWLLVGGGGFAGSVARYYLSGLAVQLSGASRFPIGTLTVNAIGCLLIGMLSGVAAQSALGTPAARLLLITGFLGGFTTFSAFGLDTYSLLRGDQLALAASNVVAQLIVGLAAVWIGHRIILAAGGLG